MPTPPPQTSSSGRHQVRCLGGRNAWHFSSAVEDKQVRPLFLEVYCLRFTFLAVQTPGSIFFLLACVLLVSLQGTWTLIRNDLLSASCCTPADQNTSLPLPGRVGLPRVLHSRYHLLLTNVKLVKSGY